MRATAIRWTLFLTAVLSCISKEQAALLAPKAAFSSACHAISTSVTAFTEERASGTKKAARKERTSLRPL